MRLRRRSVACSACWGFRPGFWAVQRQSSVFSSPVASRKKVFVVKWFPNMDWLGLANPLFQTTSLPGLPMFSPRPKRRLFAKARCSRICFWKSPLKTFKFFVASLYQRVTSTEDTQVRPKPLAHWDDGRGVVRVPAHLAREGWG